MISGFRGIPGHCLLIGTLATNFCQAEWTDWRFESADTPHYFQKVIKGGVVSDNSGNIHIVYAGDRLYLGVYNGEVWDREEVVLPSGVCRHAVIDLDPDGDPHVLIIVRHHETDEYGVEYVFKKNGTWFFESIARERIEQTSPSIAVDSTGQPHIAWHRGGWSHHKIVYMYRDVSTWHSSEVQGATIVDLVIDSLDTSHIIYANPSSGGIWHAVGGESIIEHVCIDERDVRSLSAAIDPLNTIHVAYATSLESWYARTSFDDSTGWRIDRIEGPNMNARVEIAVGGTEPEYPWISVFRSGQIFLPHVGPDEWEGDYLARVESDASLAIDGNGAPHVFYFNDFSSAGDILIHAEKREDQWEMTYVDTSRSVGEYSSLALDSMGLPHISYGRSDANQLLYTRWDGSNWNREVLPLGTDSYIHLGLDNLDKPYIAVAGARSVFFDGTEWQTDYFQATSVEECAFNMDACGTSHLLYSISRIQTMSSYELHYARRSGSGWEDTIVEGISAVPLYRGLSVDSSGRPHALVRGSPYDLTVYYGVLENGTWEFEPLDIQHAQEYCLTVDSQNRPHIGYYVRNEAVGYGLRYAFRDSLGWHTQVVDGWGGAGYHASIAVDSYDRPYFSYFHNTNHDLQFAARQGDEWIVKIVKKDIGFSDDYPTYGGYTSLVVNDEGIPYISYYNAITGDLELAVGAAVQESEPSLYWQPSPFSLEIGGGASGYNESLIRISTEYTALFRITVYDLLGRRRHRLFNGILTEGDHRLIWNAVDESGNTVPCGTYVCTVVSGENKASERIVIVR